MQLVRIFVERYCFGVYVHNAGHRGVSYRDTMVLLEHLSHCKPGYHCYEKRKQAAQVRKQATESNLTCMRTTRKPTRMCASGAGSGADMSLLYSIVQGCGTEFAVLILVQFLVVSWEFWAT